MSFPEGREASRFASPRRTGTLSAVVAVQVDPNTGLQVTMSGTNEYMKNEKFVNPLERAMQK